MSWLALTLALAPTAAADVPPGILVNPTATERAVPPGILVGEVAGASSTHTLTLDLADRGIRADHLDGALAVTLGFPFLSEREVTGFVIPAETCGTRTDIELHPPDPGEPVEIPESCWSDDGLTLRAELGRAGSWSLKVRLVDAESGAWVHPTSIRGFNPQPEPPALVALDLGVGSPGLVVEVEVTDQNGTVYGL